MNKTDLIAAVAQKAEISKKDAEKAVNALTAAVTEALCEGDKVQLVGFGTFEVRSREAYRQDSELRHVLHVLQGQGLRAVGFDRPRWGGKDHGGLAFRLHNAARRQARGGN